VSVPGLREAEQISLAVSATEVAQHRRLLVGLNALSDRLDAKVNAELDHPVNDRRGALVARDCGRSLSRASSPGKRPGCG
jgi:hypothetical protein